MAKVYVPLHGFEAAICRLPKGAAIRALVAVECEEPFDIIICDFMLPGISGVDFVERLRVMLG